MKVQHLSNHELDWVVAQCEGHKNVIGWQVFVHDENGNERQFCPSEDWRHGGPIIERERISLRIAHDGWWQAYKLNLNDELMSVFLDEEPLVAAMRCYVASKLGSEIELPASLL